MKNLIVLFIVLSILFIACGSSDENQGGNSFLDKKVALIKSEKENEGKLVAQIVGISKLKSEHGDKVNPYIDAIFKDICKNNQKYQLGDFKESPNRKLDIPSDKTQIHLKNNYPSGNVLFYLMKGKKVVLKHIFDFNTEQKFEVEPGQYDILFVIDRKFNKNIFVFKASKTLSGGKLFLGEFNITSQYNKSGSCDPGFHSDDDMCLKPIFKILDNCDEGSHLVEHLCCEEGFNFIMDGKCSRYSDKVESVVCPAGYHEAGKGRCCPKGYVLIENKCQEPPKESK